MRLQPESAMRRETDSSGESGCVAKALISRKFSLAAGRGCWSVKAVFRRGFAGCAKGEKDIPGPRSWRVAGSILARALQPQVTSRLTFFRFARVQLQGSITALATPFSASGALELSAWHTLLDAQLRGGTQALVVAGSTGEAAMLSDAEFSTLIESASRQVAGVVPILAGAGLSATDKTIHQCALAADSGADAVLVVTPPYVRPTQEGLRRHFEAVANAARVPVVLYNVPPRTGCDLLPETVAMLAAHPNIMGIKEVVTVAGRVQALVALRSTTFALCWGDDPSACQALLDGADAVISVASNAVPAVFRALCDAALRGDAVKARALDAELAPLYAALSLEPNPVPLKALLAELGLCEDALRLPLMPLSSPHRAALRAAASAASAVEARVRKA